MIMTISTTFMLIGYQYFNLQIKLLIKNWSVWYVCKNKLKDVFNNLLIL